jgi:beta-lactamase regulating signal transducer with metallopeptidase domain
MLSFFINNLSYTIFDNILFSSILWLLYDQLKNIFHLNAERKYLIALTILTIGTLYFWYDLFSVKQIHFIQYLNVANIFHGLNISILNSIFVIIYLAILFILILKFAFQYISLRKLKNNSDFSTNQYFELLLQVTPIALNENLKIGLNKAIISPIVFGVLEHIVLLPVSLCNQIEKNELKMLLLHEYAHITRKDYLLNLMIELSGMLLWFNPFVYLFKKELNLQREIACDEYVVEITNNPIAYSKALLAVAENSLETNHQLFLAANSNNADFKTRIELINGIHLKSNQKTNQKITLMAFFLMIGSLFFLNASKTSPVNNVKFEKHTLASISSSQIHKLYLDKKVSLYSKKSNKIKSKISGAPKELNNIKYKPVIDKDLDYNDLVIQTKNWIKAHEDPILFTGYNENNTFNSKDSTEEVLANKLLMLSIVKSYQLKKAIFEEKVKNISKNTSNKNEVIDYLLNSSEWNEMVQYEKWVHEFLQRQ